MADTSKIIKDILRGDATAAEVGDWCCANDLKTIPKDVLLALIKDDTAEVAALALSIDEGIGCYLNVELLKMLVKRGDFPTVLPSMLFDIFMNENNSWDYDIVEYLLKDLNLRPKPEDGFDFAGLWQPEIIELFESYGVKDDE